LKLENKISIITGAGKGIGKAIALKFAEEGSTVIINNLSEENAIDVLKEIEQRTGRRHYALPGDVSIQEDVDRLVKYAIQKCGRIDILVNNAGKQSESPFLYLSTNDWDSVIDVNLKGAFFCSQLVAREMIKNKSGKIINITSIHHSIPRLNKIHYDVSKAGLTMLTMDMALELAQYRVNVNCIAPGAIETEMNKEILNSPEKLKETISRIPFNRMGKPEEIAKAALFLASDDANYITGAILNVDGGSSLR
jgi:glucose 1-dehydrogenase